MSDVPGLTDTEVETVCGGVSDLGKVITKAVDDVISAAIGSIPGNAIPPGAARSTDEDHAAVKRTAAAGRFRRPRRSQDGERDLSVASLLKPTST